jgi:hypothetical protein
MCYTSVILKYLGVSQFFYCTTPPYSMSQHGSPKFLGVYQAVDPSTYSDIYPTNPKPEVQKIAGLYTDLIQLFVDMRYLDAESVDFPPHKNPSINTTHPAKYGFTKDVVDLYQMIPYVTGDPKWNYVSDRGEFLQGGEFMSDLRRPEQELDWLGQIIDPTYSLRFDFGDKEDEMPQLSWDHPRGPYIKPFHAVLSDCGNHGSILILDTSNCRSCS